MTKQIFIRVETETGGLILIAKETDPIETFKGLLKLAYGQGMMAMTELFNAMADRDPDDEESVGEVPLGALTLSYFHMADINDEEGIPLSPPKVLVEDINQICEELNESSRNLMLQVNPMVGEDHIILTVRLFEQQDPQDNDNLPND